MKLPLALLLLSTSINAYAEKTFYIMSDPGQNFKDIFYVNTQLPEDWVDWFNNSCSKSYTSTEDIESDTTTLQCVNMSTAPDDFALTIPVLNIYLESSNIDSLSFISAWDINSSLLNLRAVGNTNITSLDGLQEVQSVTSLIIRDNPSLTSLNGLTNIETVMNYMYSPGSTLHIFNNQSLHDISALNNLTNFNASTFYMDDREYSVKLSSTSPICQASPFPIKAANSETPGVQATKSNFCGT